MQANMIWTRCCFYCTIIIYGIIVLSTNNNKYSFGINFISFFIFVLIISIGVCMIALFFLGFMIIFFKYDKQYEQFETVIKDNLDKQSDDTTV